MNKRWHVFGAGIETNGKAFFERKGYNQNGSECYRGTAVYWATQSSRARLMRAIANIAIEPDRQRVDFIRLIDFNGVRTQK